jgi:integrase
MRATAAPETQSIPSPQKPIRNAPNRDRLTEAKLNDLLRVRPHKQEVVWDDEYGLCVLVSRGPKNKRQATVTFRVVYYLKTEPGKPQYKKIGRYPTDINLADARTEAARIRLLAKEGRDPKRPPPDTRSGNFHEKVARFIEGHAKKNNRFWQETERIFKSYVLPEWHARNVEDIKKSDVADLLNRIGDGKIEYEAKTTDRNKKPSKRKIGTRYVARTVRAQLAVFFNWYIEEYSSDDFRSPIVKSKKWKQPPPRERSLSHDEIRALWQAAKSLGIYGAVCQTALLTAQRFHKVSQMRRADLKDHLRRDNGQAFEHVWDPTRKDDPKNKQVSVVPLSPLTRQIISTLPVIDISDSKDWIFSLDGQNPMQGWSKYKARLDRAMELELKRQASERGDDPDQVELKPWQHRDLRRTARTLMAGEGVSDFLAERCLAHAIPGVKGVYDRHEYLAEKREAFDKLAAVIERVINPQRSQARRSSPGIEARI